MQTKSVNVFNRPSPIWCLNQNLYKENCSMKNND